MIHSLIVDRLIRSVSSGQNTFDNKYDPEYVSALIPSLYGQAIIVAYNGSRTLAASKRISGDWCWKTTLTFDVSVQISGADFLRFELASPPVRINNKTSGITYCGQALTSIQFKECFNRGDISNMRSRGFLTNGKDIAFIVNGKYIEVYGNNMLKELEIDGVFQDVLKFSDFNEDTDQYPVSEDILLLMEQLFQQEQGLNVRMPVDDVLNGTTNK